MRFDNPVVSFNPRRTPTSDYTGCVSTACTWSLTRARTGPKSRWYVCERERYPRADITPCGTLPPHPCLSQWLFLSSRAGPHLRAIFRILPHGTSNVRCRFSDFAQMYESSRRTASYIRNWQRVTLEFVTFRGHVLCLDTVSNSFVSKFYRWNKYQNYSLLDAKSPISYLYII